MRINGVNGLACKILVKNLRSDTITLEPILGLPVIKDLIVDMKPFFDHYKSVMPFLVNDEPAPTTERLQSPAERARFDDSTKCILCACCTTACPPFWGDRKYVGPAAIVNAHRFIFDSRDRAAADRLEILNDAEGVWRCRTVFNCTSACPRDIKVTQTIQEVKRALMTGDVDSDDDWASSRPERTVAPNQGLAVHEGCDVIHAIALPYVEAGAFRCPPGKLRKRVSQPRRCMVRALACVIP